MAIEIAAVGVTNLASHVLGGCVHVAGMGKRPEALHGEVPHRNTRNGGKPSNSKSTICQLRRLTPLSKSLCLQSTPVSYTESVQCS